MEIITIPLQGSIKHKDSMGNESVITTGDIQVMSAGTGVQHSEYNAQDIEDLKLMQIWLFTNKREATPRYQQIPIRTLAQKDEFYQVLSPNKNDQGVWIHQNAWFHLGEFESAKNLTYKTKSKDNGVYAFVIEGNAEIQGQKLEKRDGFGLWNLDELDINVKKGAKILLMEVPMEG
jgi:redox-sensitive bicupin YhaK (pirin superfamily)